MKGYKVFNPDWTCRGFTYRVGETYEMKEGPELCKKGFHFCPKAADCFGYYGFDPENKVAEVEALGDIDGDGDKRCTNKLRVVREIPWPELLEMVNTGRNNTGSRNTGDLNTGSRNTGDLNTGSRNTGSRNTGNWNTGSRNTGSRNTGHGNTGDWNTGSRNTGHRNTGNWNTGDLNTGDWNTGSRNTGDLNTGDWNTGDWNTGSRNTGSRNTGDRNTGHWNTGDWNTADNTGGCFCTEKHTIRFFDEESGLTLDDWRDHPARIVLLTAPPSLKWIDADEMTEEEKAGNPSYETPGGYLKKLGIRAIRKERQAWWDKLPPEDREKVYGIPNFDQEKFERIMKIKVGDRDA